MGNLIHIQEGAKPLRINGLDRSHWDASSNVWAGVSALPINDTSTSGEPASQVIPVAEAAKLFEWSPMCGRSFMHENPTCFRPRLGGDLDSKGATFPSDVQTDFFGQ